MAFMKGKSQKAKGQNKGHRKVLQKPVEPVAFDGAVEVIGAKGDGLVQGPDGPVYVPYTAPGDIARIEAVGDRGTIVELVNPGPDRTDPSCLIYGECGGCALQHVSENFYRNWKETEVRGALRAAGIDPSVVAPMAAIPAASRRRAQFYITRNGDETTLGFYARRSRRLVSVDDCFVLHPALNKALPAFKLLAAAAPASWARFSMAVTLCEDGRGQEAFDLDFSNTTPLPDPSPQETARLMKAAKSAVKILRLSLHGAPLVTIEPPMVRFGEFIAAPPPGAFLQASIDGQEALINFVVDAITKSEWALKKLKPKIADLFCGCGTFTLPLSAHGTLTAYDSDEDGIITLNAAAKRAQSDGRKIKPVKAEARNLFTRPLNFKDLESFDAVVLDPPRAGAIHQARELAKAKTPMAVYVSCNPKSFARDAKILIDGGFSLRQVTPVDQFVYSSHIEIVSIFSRG